MHYNTPFQLLSGRDERLLTDPHHTDYKRSYIDILAMLHDILCEFGNFPQHATFKYFNQHVSLSKIESVAKPLKSLAASFDNNIIENTKIAFDLLEECQSHGRVAPDVARSLVDEYLGRLLKQYQRLR